MTVVPAPAGCAELLGALPERLGDLARRDTTDPARAVAWGDPAVTVVCGASDPDPQAETVQLGPIDGSPVEFAVDDIGPAYAYTPLGVAVPAVVTVPDAYDSQLLVPLVASLRAAP